MLFYRQGEYSQAVQYFQRALSLDETDTINRVWMAMAQYQLGNTNEAEDLFKHAREQWEMESDSHSDWAHQIAISLLLKEAEALIEPEKSK